MRFSCLRKCSSKGDAKHLWKFYRHLLFHDVRWERYLSFGHSIAHFWKTSKKNIWWILSWFGKVIKHPDAIKKKKWGGKYYKTALWSSKKPGTFTHCHSRHNNRTPSPTDEKEQVLLYALEHIISLKYKCLFHFILTYVGLMRKGKGYSLTFGSLQQEA